MTKSAVRPQFRRSQTLGHDTRRGTSKEHRHQPTYSNHVMGRLPLDASRRLKYRPRMARSSLSTPGPSLSILFVTPEMAPIAKAGGLADVASALPLALRRRGHEVRVVMPLYGSIDRERYSVRPFHTPMGVWMGDRQEWCAVHEARAPGDIPVYLIEHSAFFDRFGFYHDQSMQDYDDNARRFGFLCRAALQLCIDLGIRPDIVHGNDWQTALTPAYLKLWHRGEPVFERTASVLTLHNLAHQGIYRKTDYGYLGLGWENFRADRFETYDQVNLLKGGIHYADVITAVSPSFAREITTPFGGFGLAPYLSNRGGDLVGILNGIDTDVWNPETDPHLPVRYGIKDRAGKRECKRELQRRFGLAEDEHVALIGAIGRFVHQKGYQLLSESIDGILADMHAQFVILGTGEHHLEHFFGTLPARYPGRVGSYIGFDDARAHLVEAGCDLFVMPSLFEPCGLNQMYSMRYGTVPVAHATGGLNDTVEAYNEADGTGTGFKFSPADPMALHFGVGLAISTYYDRRHHFEGLVERGMSRDFSWTRSAQQYEQAYRHALRKNEG